MDKTEIPLILRLLANEECVEKPLELGKDKQQNILTGLYPLFHTSNNDKGI